MTGKKQTWHPSVKLNDGGSSPVRIRDVEKYHGRTLSDILNRLSVSNIEDVTEALLHMGFDMSAH
jgi:hypothetical protein